MLQVAVEDHGISLPKKSFRRSFPGWRTKKPGVQCSCRLYVVSRQGLYQRRQR